MYQICGSTRPPTIPLPIRQMFCAIAGGWNGTHPVVAGQALEGPGSAVCNSLSPVIGQLSVKLYLLPGTEAIPLAGLGLD